MLDGLNGVEGVKECTFVECDLTDAPFFASPVSGFEELEEASNNLRKIRRTFDAKRSNALLLDDARLICLSAIVRTCPIHDGALVLGKEDHSRNRV